MPPIELTFDTVIRVAAPLIVALVIGVTRRVIEGRPRLITYLVHATAHPLPPPTQAAGPQPPAQPVTPLQPANPAPVPAFVNTHSIVVKNTGKKTAHNVRIEHAVFPLSYQLSPTMSHTVTRGQNDSAEICIPVLVPGELVTISYLYVPPLFWHQIVGGVKSDEGMARTIQTIPTSPPPRAVVWLLWTLIFIGASFVAYWVLRLAPLVLTSGTPAS
jgi:hypothetical protein